MPFPDIDPIAFQIGPLAVRWYGLAYFFGIMGGIWLGKHYAGKYPVFGLSRTEFEDFGFLSIFGVLIGGRLGSVLFYNLDFYLDNPIEIFKVWNGGMSFHGGLIGVLVVAAIFCRRRRIGFLDLGDVLACVAPIGLLFGRLANFVNGELWGRPTTVSWGMVFPQADAQPRHPSQLYEAGLEGLVLLVVLALLIRVPALRLRPGFLGGVFLAGYGLFRFLVEYSREPDAGLIGFLTRGQAYSLPMVVAGAWLIWRAFRVPARVASVDPKPSSP